MQSLCNATYINFYGLGNERWADNFNNFKLSGPERSFLNPVMSVQRPSLEMLSRKRFHGFQGKTVGIGMGLVGGIPLLERQTRMSISFVFADLVTIFETFKNS